MKKFLYYLLIVFMIAFTIFGWLVYICGSQWITPMRTFY